MREKNLRWADNALSNSAAPVTDTSGVELATPADRFAAQVLDAATCILLFWYGVATVARHLGNLSVLVQGFEVRATVMHITLGLFVLAVCVYFFVTEWIVAASIGKILCGLRVKTIDGSRCTFAASFLRNLLRPIDSVAVSSVLLLSARRQRLGDRIAGTVVVRLRRQMRSRPTNVPVVSLAHWEQRGQATLIDAVLLILFASAYLVLTGCIGKHNGIQVDCRGYPLTVLVIFIFFYFVITEGGCGATPGQTLTGLRVIQKSGSPCGFTAATVRTLFKPFDLLPMCLPAFVMVRFTQARQTIGDLAASTIVVHLDNVVTARDIASRRDD